MKYLKFKNGDIMPALGLGTWKSSTGEVFKAVKTAIKIGYRHIDCAPVYGNEKEIGMAIAECISEGLITREELWVTSKLWNSSHRKEQVVPAIEKTLADLQVSYLDIYLVHWPIALKENVGFPAKGGDFYPINEIPLTETWQGMETVFNKKLARHIGVSNFGPVNLQHILDNAKVTPEMNQVECHPYLQQQQLFDYCTSHSIFLTAYSPLGSFDPKRITDSPAILKDPLIGKLAEKRGVSPAQILISWALQRGISAIPKSTNANRIAENFEANTIELTDDKMHQIEDLDKDFRYVDGKFWTVNKSPYTLEEIWR